MLRKLVPFLLLSTLLIVMVAPDTSVAQVGGQKGATVAENGMVATSNRYATLAGIEALRQGGNAVDAMAVVQFVLNVTEPYASGIGGGAFIMIYDAATGEVVAIDGREEAPAAYTEDVFLDEEGNTLPFFEAATGGNSVGVPGTLAAVARALEEYGTFTLAEAMAPAIQLARSGFTIDAYFADQIASNAERIKLFPATAAMYLDAEGNPLPEGTVITNPELADTFELIASEGIDVFYGGEIGAAIVDAVQNAPVNPGVMELSDLENYRAVRRQPVTTNYRGYDVYGMNMPTSGGTTLMLMLNLLEGFDMSSVEWGSLDYITLMANVQNVAFADRNQYMADADFVDVNVAGLLDANYARERRALVSTTNAAVGVPAGTPPVIEPEGETTSYEFGINPDDTESISTTHFSIIDKDRNMVSVTSTIELLFGSAVSVPGYGFLLNNELTDFSFRYQDADGNPIANAPTGERALRRTALGEDANTEGGKRPRSSMSPTLVLRNGQPFMAVGTPGGSRIIGYVFNVLVHVIDYDMELQEAVNAPRVVGRNGALTVDPEFFTPELVGGLQARGFDVRQPNTGSVQAVMVGDDGLLYGAADYRRLGLALGH
ncbi:MAG: gamma-glutamyltransferase [Phototrophicales bacterium]|nr:MAG: gamma-glutamyltransferase [Phototrophicales bacterium]